MVIFYLFVARFLSRDESLLFHKGKEDYRKYSNADQNKRRST